MRILGFFHRNRVAPVFFMLSSLGFVSGCSDNAPVGGTGVTAASKAKEESEREARQNAYGKKGIPAGTKREAESSAKK
jgi:hypothetical protein